MSSARRTTLTVGLACLFLSLPSCSSKREVVRKEGAGDALRDGGVITKVEKLRGGKTLVGEVVGVVDAPRESVWKIISDYNGQKDYMPNILECFVIRREALELLKNADPGDLRRLEDKLRKYKTDEVRGKVVYIYGVGDFPWPLPNKRYVLKIVRDVERYTTHATMVIGEMRTNESFWELKPYGGDGSKTLAKYKILLDPGVPAPEFMVNIAVKTTLPAVIEALRARVKTTKHGRRREEAT